MAVTLGALVGRVQRKVDNVADGRRVVQKEVIDEINEAVRQVVQRIAAVWPEYYLRTSQTQKAQEDIVDGTANADLPAGMYLIIMVTAENSDGDTSRLQQLSIERTLNSDADGYYLLNDDIYLYPTPDLDATITDGLTIYYINRPTEVTTLATAVPFADDWQDAIVTWAVAKIRAGQNSKAADFAMLHSMVESHVNAMVVRTNMSEDDAGLTVPGRTWI